MLIKGVKGRMAEWPNLVLWAFLLSPLTIKLITSYRYSKIDLLVFYTIAMSVLWLLAIRFVSSNQFRVHVILLPFYLVATVDLFLVLNFNSRLTAAYVFVGLTNYKCFMQRIFPLCAAVLTTSGCNAWQTGKTGILPYRMPNSTSTHG